MHEQQPAIENPLLKLSQSTQDVLRVLSARMRRERIPEEEHLTPQGVAAHRLVEALSVMQRLPEGFNHQRYEQLVNDIAQLEAALPHTSPSVAVEEVGLALRGRPEDAVRLEQMREELTALDATMTSVIGLSPMEVQNMVDDPKYPKHESNLAGDLREAEQRRLEGVCRKFAAQGAKWQLEFAYGQKQDAFSEDARQLAQKLFDGVESEELAPKPEAGTFQTLDDADPEHANRSVVCYERQFVRSQHDIMSPDFSSCAGVVLYRINEDGMPENETIVAHLPPRRTSEEESSFDSYTPLFLQEHFANYGLQRLDGYNAKIFSGLKVPPDRIAESIQKLGGTIAGIEQIPKDMYQALIDRKTKMIAVRGIDERVAQNSSEATYRTDRGRVPIKQDPNIATSDGKTIAVLSI